MNSIIELHDSTVAEISRQQGKIVVHFFPAYLHKSEGRPGFDSGTVWTQEARLVFTRATVSGEFPDLPCEVMDGELVINGERHDNHIPVPLAIATSAEVHLIFDSIHTVTVTGRGVGLELVGEPRYVGEFSR